MRTSIVGHELAHPPRAVSSGSWPSPGPVAGYRRADLLRAPDRGAGSRRRRSIILPRPGACRGLLPPVAADPIAKLDLLRARGASGTAPRPSSSPLRRTGHRPLARLGSRFASRHRATAPPSWPAARGWDVCQDAIEPLWLDRFRPETAAPCTDPRDRRCSRPGPGTPAAASSPVAARAPDPDRGHDAHRAPRRSGTVLPTSSVSGRSVTSRSVTDGTAQDAASPPGPSPSRSARTTRRAGAGRSHRSRAARAMIRRAGSADPRPLEPRPGPRVDAHTRLATRAPSAAARRGLEERGQPVGDVDVLLPGGG